MSLAKDNLLYARVVQSEALRCVADAARNNSCFTLNTEKNHRDVHGMLVSPKNLLVSGSYAYRWQWGPHAIGLIRA